MYIRIRDTFLRAHLDGWRLIYASPRIWIGITICYPSDWVIGINTRYDDEGEKTGHTLYLLFIRIITCR